ncbi:mechanosensitive ion channel family protein [Sphingobacterium sp. FBM7-1]|uniref:mechanosensitive ion channel family protein n=1 Tax=Sphingobacterium sp. FBM7-1 TaxID=2886688 RepID=UPI001D108D39|nr:mechanosensitive ion channel domain-containing protein [Sphingobacterium sp. FBM7-1]MCC2598567.1 mechanosensitive ion channel family protein [Sphingobacterium sp. FBM7-1]
MMTEELARLSQSMPVWLWNIILILFSIFTGILIKMILLPLVRKEAIAQSSYSFFRSFIRHFNKILGLFIPLIVFSSLLPFSRFNPATLTVVSKIVEILLIASFAILLVRTVRMFEDYLYHRFDVNKENNLRERKIRTQIVFIRKLINTIIIIVAIAIALLSFESMQKIGAGLLTGVGVGGIIIGFAAQKSLGNLLAGFQIAFTQPLRMDDVLIVEGEWGRVEEINLTYVVVNIWDKRRLVLPINYFIEKPFQNWTRNTAEILGTVFIYVDFSVPVQQLRDKLTELLTGHPLWDGQVNVLQVTDFKERTMEIRCLMSCRNSGHAFDLRCYVREQMIDYIKHQFPESLSKTRVSLDSTSTGHVDQQLKM